MAETRQEFAHSGPALLAHARDAALDWKAATGGKTVGYLGADVPPALILACGCLPVRLGAFMAADSAAAAHIHETGESAVVARLASLFLGGSLGWLDHVVIGNSPPWHVTLLHFLREHRRLEPSAPGPSVSLHEIHRSDGEATQAYNRDSCRRLLDRLSAIGRRPDDRQLRAAIEILNARNTETSAVLAQRRSNPPLISGADAALMIALHQTDWTQAPPKPDCRPRPGLRILLSGSDIGHLGHHAMIEAAGCTIVADDHDWGEASIETRTGAGDPLAALAESCTRQAPRAARWPARTRIPSVVARAREARVDGVVFWLNDEDHPSSWDLPKLIDALERERIPTLDLGPMPLSPDPSAVTERVRTWLQRLGASTREMQA